VKALGSVVFANEEVGTLKTAGAVTREVEKADNDSQAVSLVILPWHLEEKPSSPCSRFEDALLSSGAV